MQPMEMVFHIHTHVELVPSKQSEKDADKIRNYAYDEHVKEVGISK